LFIPPTPIYTAFSLFTNQNTAISILCHQTIIFTFFCAATAKHNSDTVLRTLSGIGLTSII